VETVETEIGAVAPASDYVSEASFDDLGLSEPVRLGVAERGYTRPTPVQLKTYKPVVEGRDVIVRSKTGTGKTAAFGIPMLERIPAGRRRVSGLVMCPTRELALQVADEVAALGKHKDLSVVAIYGGASMSEQLDKLRHGAEIVVGTPGRIYDHIRRGTLDLDGVMISVLDEADEMLNMGFFEEVTRILDHLPDDCQQMLFSATVPADIEQIVREYLTDPETILLSGDEYTVDNIHNVMYHTVDAYPKPRNLLYMIETEEPDSAIVFCNTRNDTSLVTAVLNRNGYDADLLNGELPQKERERVMAKVKRGEVRFMVATDIAARGIDISDLTHVINYSLPEDPAVYLHRVGRTGRIGKKGTALSLVSGAEITTLSVLQKKFQITFEERQLPTPEEARKRWTDRHIGELKEAMSSSIFEAFIPLAQDLKTRPEGDYLISFALKYFFTHHRIEKMTDVQKAEHKRQEREREKRAESRSSEEGDRGEKPKRSRKRSDHRDEPRESRDAREPGESREPRERRERREPRQSREARGAREPQPATATASGPEGAPEATPSGSSEPREVEQRSVEAQPRPVDAEPRSVEPRSGEDRPSVEASSGEAALPAQTKIYLSLGERDGADEAKVREVVGQLAPGTDILALELRRNHTYLQVKPEAADQVIAALAGKEVDGRALTAERAKRRRR
jgi:ATP-dependent RNA helicase DeaD